MLQLQNINGFQVALCHIPTPIVTVRVIINAGSYQDKTPGTAHFLEHMFFKGTQKRGYEEINQTLAAIGDPNAHTSVTKTVYHINTTRAHIVKAFELLCEMLFLPAFSPKELDKERTVILEEWQATRDDPIGYFLDESMDWLLPPALGHRILGTQQSITEMSVDHLTDFRDTYYNTSNIMFAIVGDVQALPHKIENLLAQYSLPTGEINEIPTVGIRFGKWDEPLQHSITHTSTQACLGLWAPSLTLQQSYDQHFSDNVTYNLIGGGMHSLLFDRLREKLGLCYATGIYETRFWDNSLGCAYALLDKTNIQKATDEIRRTLEDTAQGKFSDQLLETAKANTLFGLAQGAETAGGYAWNYVDPIFATRNIAPELAEKYNYELVRGRIESCPLDELRKRVMKDAEFFQEGLSVTTMNSKTKQSET